MKKLLGGLVPLLAGTCIIGIWLFDSPTVFVVADSWLLAAIITEMLIGLSLAIFGIYILLTKEKKFE